MSVILPACNNFEEINTDPTSSTVVSPDMLVSQVLKNTFKFWNPNPWDFSTANMSNKHIAVNDANPYQYYSSYWPYGDFGGFKNQTDLKKAVEFAQGSDAAVSYEAFRLFHKAWIGYNATVNMGDIPYSEAVMAEQGIVKPKYDKQVDVFNYILEDLTQADALFAQGHSFSGDFMYGGDPTKWRKLVNAFQLKVILTMSRHITPELKAKFASIVAANHLMTSNDDTFKLVYSENSNASYPFYNGEWRRLNLSVSKLTADYLKSTNDRRLFYFGEPAAQQISNGLAENDYNAYVGCPTERNGSLLATDYEAGMYSLLNKRYPLYRANDPMLIFTYSEQCFIIAEAIELGWTSGNAQLQYENGVKSELNYYKNLPNTADHVHGMAIDDNYVNNYFTGNAAYPSSGTQTDRLHQIWMQRWLIYFFQGNGGDYPQFLRTGYPLYPLDPATSQNIDPNVYPKRLMYPDGEKTTNLENYQNAIDTQYNGIDNVLGKPWYLQ